MILHEFGTRARVCTTSIMRADRDNYVTIDLGNVARKCAESIQQAGIADRRGRTTLARSCITARTISRSIDRRPTIIPKPQYQREAEQMGQRLALSETDHNMMAVLYFSQMNREHHSRTRRRLRATVSTVPTCCWRWSDCTRST